MDKDIIEYRTKYKKCKWCKYYKYHSPSSRIPGITCADYETCELKDKIIHFTDFSVICKYYKVKEEKK